eukprot:snap_masked-scaffold_3-processed-gene-7.35-mRNA-1 protein AED:1.00 eAED:1.00 QI:0/-1/0/0/-1/1/1/0/230
MSYFRTIPPPESLRAEALDAAEKYFEEHGFSSNTLSLLSIIVPSAKPLKNFPKSYKCCHTWWRLFETPCHAVKFECELETTSFGEICFIFWGRIIDLFLYLTLWIFQCFCLFDASFSLDVPDRRDLVQTSFLIYPVGLFVYRRQLEQLHCMSCFNAPSMDHFYHPTDSSMHLFAWPSTNITSYDLTNDSCFEKNKNFIRFFINERIFLHKTETYDALRNFERKFKGENMV